jgi:hypothetical protein
MARKLPASETLSALGYQPLHDRVYKATWGSPDVEHFLFLGGTPRGINAAFGIRNPAAEAFAQQSIVKYGGEMFGRIEHDEQSSCTMRFGFAVCDPFWARSVRGLFDPALGPTLQRLLREFILPAVGHVTTIDGLIDLLLADQRPCLWSFTNGAIRAAQIISLAGHCGHPAARISAALEARGGFIARGFLNSAPMRKAPAEYVRRVLGDWSARPQPST